VAELLGSRRDSGIVNLQAAVLPLFVAIPNGRAPDMLDDAYGNSVGTQSSDVRDAYDLGVHRFLGAEPCVAEAFEAAIEADEGFALAHIDLARALASGLSARERSHINASALLLEGKSAEAPGCGL
jgi:hypothetical protein